MLMKPDKKKMAAMIVASNKSVPEMAEPEEMSDNSMAEEAAAEDLLAAIEQKSAKGIVDAIKTIMDIIEPESEPAESEE